MNPIDHLRGVVGGAGGCLVVLEIDAFDTFAVPFAAKWIDLVEALKQKDNN